MRWGRVRTSRRMTAHIPCRHSKSKRAHVVGGVHFGMHDGRKRLCGRSGPLRLHCCSWRWQGCLSRVCREASLYLWQYIWGNGVWAHSRARLLLPASPSCFSCPPSYSTLRTPPQSTKFAHQSHTHTHSTWRTTQDTTTLFPPRRQHDQDQAADVHLLHHPLSLRHA